MTIIYIEVRPPASKENKIYASTMLEMIRKRWAACTIVYRIMFFVQTITLAITSHKFTLILW